MPSPVEHQGHVPLHGPGIAPDPLRWDFRLNWQRWKQVWERGLLLQDVLLLWRQHPAQPVPAFLMLISASDLQLGPDPAFPGLLFLAFPALPSP